MRKKVNLAEWLGIDWLPILFCPRKLDDQFACQAPTEDLLNFRPDSDDGEEKLEDALEFCQTLIEYESRRSDKIEDKAYKLIGISATSVGLVSAVGVFLLDMDKLSLSFWVIVCLGFYLFILLSCFLVIVLAMRVVQVGKYTTTLPPTPVGEQFKTSTLLDIKANRLSTLLRCLSSNREVGNHKATYLQGAQIWFRNAVVLMLILLAIFSSTLLAQLEPISLSRPLTATPEQSLDVPSVSPSVELSPVPTIPNSPTLAPDVTQVPVASTPVPAS